MAGWEEWLRVKLGATILGQSVNWSYTLRPG